MSIKKIDTESRIENIQQTIDNQIFKLQKELGMSGYMLAKIIGYSSPDSVYRAKRGETHFGINAIVGLHIAYPNLNLNYFVDPSISPWKEDVNQNIDNSIKALTKSLDNLKALKSR